MDYRQKIVELNKQLEQLTKDYLETNERLVSSESSLQAELSETEASIKSVVAEIEKLKERHIKLKESLSSIKCSLNRVRDDIQFKTGKYELDKCALSVQIEKLENMEKSLEKQAEQVISECVLNDMDLFMKTLQKNMTPVAPVKEESQVEVSIFDFSEVDKYLKNSSKYTLVGYKKPDGKIITRGIKSCPENFRLVKTCLEIAGCVCKGNIADTIKKLDYKSEYDSEQLAKLVVYTKTEKGFEVVTATSTVTDEDIDKVFTQMNNHRNNTDEVNLLYGACARLLVSGVKSDIKHLPSEIVRNTLHNVDSELNGADYKLILEVI